MMIRLITLSLLLFLNACATTPAPPTFDLIIRNGMVYDGSGGPPQPLDLGIEDDRITAVADLDDARADQIIDADGLAVAPGFINMLSWAVESLIEDGRGVSDIRQGVTTEVFGEGWSMGPLGEAMRNELPWGDIHYEVSWTTLGEYLELLANRGVAPNVASFVGATTIRIHQLGYEDRPPTPAELERMQELVREAMREGALGVGASLIYAPAFYADTDELVALASAAGEFGGMYITHMRSEGNRLIEAVEETFEIARRANVPAEIYHLKAAGRDNWPKMARVLEMIDQARAEGLGITADIYSYTAGATGLDAAMPPWVQEGGDEAWVERLKDPAIRARVLEEMRTPTDEWENLYLAAGSADKVLLAGFSNPDLKPLTGMTLNDVAEQRGTSPEDTIIDLVIEDESRVDTVYFLMSEDNIRAQLAKPWVSLGSDAEALEPAGVFLQRNPHPRAYGNFARFLGRYVREQGVMELSEAIRRLTTLPAENLKLRDRGRLQPGYFADVVIFDPATIQDHATYAEPHQLATGVRDVVINGELVLRNEQPTGALPGRVLRGPGWTDWNQL